MNPEKILKEHKINQDYRFILGPVKNYIEKNRPDSKESPRAKHIASRFLTRKIPLYSERFSVTDNNREKVGELDNVVSKINSLIEKQKLDYTELNTLYTEAAKILTKD